MHIELYRKVDGPDGGPDSVQSETVLLRKVNENFIHQHFVTLSEWAIPDLQNRFTVYLAPVCVCMCVCVYVACVCVLSYRFQTVLKTLKERSIGRATQQSFNIKRRISKYTGATGNK